jgi:hypothetical protein
VFVARVDSDRTFGFRGRIVVHLNLAARLLERQLNALAKRFESRTFPITLPGFCLQSFIPVTFQRAKKYFVQWLDGFNAQEGKVIVVNLYPFVKSRGVEMSLMTFQN